MVQGKSPPIPSTNGSSHPPLSIQEVTLIRSGCGIRWLVMLCGMISHLLSENDSRLVALNSDVESEAGDDGDHNVDKASERKQEIRQ